MTAEAERHNAINLGQGFPDSDGPPEMLKIAQAEIARGNNQCSPPRGVHSLRAAVAATRNVPVDDVLITVGATEAITATILGLVEPGAEVIVFEPYYDAYIAAIALAGATRVPVPLREVGNTWDIDIEAFAAAITPKTSMVIINSPHNPTGAVFPAKTLLLLAKVCQEHDLLVLSDEVYENLVFSPAQHTRFAELPGMYERTVTASSAAKSYNATGWKTGWAIAPPELLEGVMRAKQFMTYTGATPFQAAVAHAIEHELQWLKSMTANLATSRDILTAGLVRAGLHIHDSLGTFFVVADVNSSTYSNAEEFCRALPAERGVAAIPISAFCDNPEPFSTKVRFAFCKQPDVIREAVKRFTTR